jgi:hypothetical protein
MSDTIDQFVFSVESLQQMLSTEAFSSLLSNEQTTAGLCEID